MQNPQDVQLAAETLKKLLPAWFADLAANAMGIVLGTGLSDTIASALASGKCEEIPYAAIPDFPQSGVKSHTGAFICGILNGLPVLAQQGRCHLYEGRPPEQVCMGVRVMAKLGIETLIVTNAAGALNPLFEPGSLMCMSDMINYTGVSPLTGANCDEWGERFPDMSAPFDADLRSLAMECALKAKIRMEQGVYIGVHGPEMETPAETRMYRQWGADAIGMSTVLEVIAARHMGMRVLGISCIANRNLPDCMRPAPLEEIIEISALAGKDLGTVIGDICAALAAG